MKVLIIEDEKPAAKRMTYLLKQYNESIEIPAVLQSVKASIRWFETNPHPDLVFSDIQLADGLSFEIYNTINVKLPIIFTTAYDEYAIRAFKLNSVDYLLKPIERNELYAAISKFNTNFKKPSENNTFSPEVMKKLMQSVLNEYKSRFVVRVGEHIRTVDISDILYFYSFEKATFMYTADQKNYVVDYSLEQLEKMIDPKRFFRVNRQYLVSLKSIKDIVVFSNRRLKVALISGTNNSIIASRDRVAGFKEWLDG